MQKIHTLIAAEMAALANQITVLLQEEHHWIHELTQHTFRAPGKQVRPMLVFLAAGACGGITPKAHRGAMLVTLLHQASLLHDDVVDEAVRRRGKTTINTVWNNKVAILFGDYLLAKLLQLITQHQDHDLLALITATAHAMSVGELRQLSQVRQFDTTEAAYLDIIYKKTAYFMGTCLAIGAMTAGADAVRVATLRQVGEHFGRAFQLKDDWQNYDINDLDKPLGLDLQNSLLTLPLIRALQQATAQERKEMLHTLVQTQHQPQQKERVLSFVRASTGMDYTQKMMLRYKKKALGLLATMTCSPHQKALCALIKQLL
mmetsp:Transcript_9510/g.21826  ORF Transcript_9510/g.21826 Transcript_9510/m.21826 type:complete len:317 (-) Transcript_9510:1070-2020(-)